MAAPACQLIKDAARDEQPWVSPLGFTDILSADIATDPRGREISATWRVRTLENFMVGPQTYWSITFRVAGTQTVVRVSAGGPYYIPGVMREEAGGALVEVTDAKGVFQHYGQGPIRVDTEKDEVRLRAPIGHDVEYWDDSSNGYLSMRLVLRPKQRLARLVARTATDVEGSSGLGPYDEAAASPKTLYVVGAPSCINPHRPFD